jgi:lysyl-tRNA synthetase class 2
VSETAANLTENIPEQVQVRLDKRAKLLDEGVQPYPVDLRRSHTLSEVRAQWPDLQAGDETQDVVSVGGRVIFVRNTGKLCFATLQDGFTLEANSARLQVMISLAEVGQDALDAWKADVDLGDFVWVKGRVISSKRGELSVQAGEWAMAAKALRPLPVLHKELNEETRVRQRYNDLIVRPEAQEMVRLRAGITAAVRTTLEQQGFIEVETPILQLVHGGAAARPFNTHLNAFDIDMSLRIALELYLKRVMVGGADRTYEIGRVFRNEGIDSSHSAEFTMLEAYQSWGDQFTIAEVIKDVIMAAADVAGVHQIERPDGTVIDLDGEWTWLPLIDGLSAKLGTEVSLATPAKDLQAIFEKHELDFDPAWATDKLIIELFEHLVEPDLVQPTFVCDFPAIAQPLARPHRSKPGLIEAWDLMIGGLERGTGFSELIDPVIQRDVLTKQSLKAAAGDPEAMQLDEDFLQALEQGVPPMGGLGLGMDRLLMLFTTAGIRETILFPLLRPQG